MRSVPRVAALLLVGMGALGAVMSAGLLNSYYVYLVDLVLINSIAVIGLVVLSGIGGMMSLGTAALIAIGAYTTSMLCVHLHVAFLPAMLAGMLASLVIGSALAGPALRLGGLHLAIVTLAFGIIVLQLISKGGTLTGGTTGLTLPAVDIAGYALDSDSRKYWPIAAVFILAAVTAMHLAVTKPGRALLVLKEREVMARALGIDTNAYKALAFAYSSLLAGAAGGLFALLKGYVSVDDFSLDYAIYLFVMIVIGGMTSILGGVLGATFVTLLPELLSDFKDSAAAIFGVVTMLVILLLPGGLVSVGRLFRRRRVVTDAEGGAA